MFSCLQSKDELLAFFRWQNEQFPPEDGVPSGRKSPRVPLETSSLKIRSYVTAEQMDKGGHVLLRPYHLPHEAACGLKGIVESAARTHIIPTIAIVNLEHAVSEKHLSPFMSGKLFLLAHDPAVESCFSCNPETNSCEDLLHQLCQLILLNGCRGRKCCSGRLPASFLHASLRASPVLAASTEIASLCI